MHQHHHHHQHRSSVKSHPTQTNDDSIPFDGSLEQKSQDRDRTIQTIKNQKQRIVQMNQNNTMIQSQQMKKNTESQQQYSMHRGTSSSSSSPSLTLHSPRLLASAA